MITLVSVRACAASMSLLPRTFFKVMRKAFLLLLPFFVTQLFPEDWPRWRGLRGDGTREAPKLSDKWPEDGLQRIWKRSVSPSFSGVSVADGRVFLMDRPDKSKHGETERVLCLNADSGDILWSFSYKAEYGDLDYGKGPRASVTVRSRKAYTLGAVGHAFCLDVETGKKLWFRDLAGEEQARVPTWGFSAAPEPYGERMLYHVGARPTGSVLSLDATTGETRWRTGKEPAGYGPPVSITRGGRSELICWGRITL
jgi:outer membrane protein assembly factor BamB